MRPSPSENPELVPHQPVWAPPHVCHPRLFRDLFLILTLDAVRSPSSSLWPTLTPPPAASCPFPVFIYLLLAQVASPEDGEQPSCLHATSHHSGSAVWFAAEPPLGKWLSLCAEKLKPGWIEAPQCLSAFLALQEVIQETLLSSSRHSLQ